MVKISDVAHHAGVSPSTVSYVLSGKRSISDQTRRRVMDSIRALGYRPHAGARALASNRSNVIALVVPLRSGIHVPIVMQMVIAAVTTARTYDHDVLLLTQDEGVGGLERVAGSSLVDAIIVMDVELHDLRLPVLRSLERPSVLIGFPADPTGLTCIDWDFEAAGAACAEYLADLGHREIALIGAPPAVYERGTGFAERTKAGFQRAAAERGVDAVVRPCDPDNARAAADDLLRDHPGLTGIAVHNEPAVEPLLTAFRASGRHIPDDLSLVAIAPDDLAERLDLTSISIPAEELGRQAVVRLMEKLDGHQPPGATLLPSRLVVRSSTPAT
ncbi:LacI family transcriptional regulator [Actinoallomurus purpureus]|uniref:LacI family DNA-binding transcriptional regulator n=1 Tax=Actinoallomurus purpureus TaxID=478114 RepID=UPI00209365F7|nr:LacI family DNA-binding transcriptional regulator [Actinoallomurus purpureus]MCO6010333.1 LacI family transcriptional regulator [Actinoallomurus purpureus]